MVSHEDNGVHGICPVDIRPEDYEGRTISRISDMARMLLQQRLVVYTPLMTVYPMSCSLFSLFQVEGCVPHVTYINLRAFTSVPLA